MIEVSKANEADFPGIMAVLNFNLLDKKENPNSLELSQQGFLVHGFSETDLFNYQQNAKAIVLVAKQDDKVIGYEIAYVMDDAEKKTFLDKSNLSTEKSSALQSQQILYHRHIARLPQSHGAGALLIKDLITHANEQNCDVILCLIATAPLHNKISEEFHQRFGFKKIAEVYNPEEKKGYGVFALDLSGAHS